MDANSGNVHSYYSPGLSPQSPQEVSSLSRDELEDIMNCDDKLEDFVESLPQLGAIRNQCDQLMQNNMALANANLEFKGDYEKNRDTTIQKVEELTSLRNNFDNLTLRHQDITETLAPSNLQESVMIAAVQSEEDSENIAEKFLDKKIDVDTFLNQYLEKRIESHLRKFKGERFGRQLRELQKAGF